MLEFVYPAKCTRGRKDGGYVVTFRDLPETITQADTIAQCVEEAAGAVQATIEDRIMDGLAIPAPSRAKRGERLVSVPVQTALKAALYLAMREPGITRVELARPADVLEHVGHRHDVEGLVRKAHLLKKARNDGQPKVLSRKLRQAGGRFDTRGDPSSTPRMPEKEAHLGPHIQESPGRLESLQELQVI